MKKVIVLILSLTFVLALAGCGKTTGGGDPVVGGGEPVAGGADMPTVENDGVIQTEQTQPAVTEEDAPTEIETIDYSPMVMFNDILYTATDYSGEKKDLSVVGKIESCIDYGVPTENNQANTSLVGAEIYTTSSAPDFIFVLNNGEYSSYKSTDGTGIE